MLETKTGPFVANEDRNAEQAMEIHRIKLNSQGYDNFGSYYGIGAPLYQLLAEDQSENDLDGIAFRRSSTVRIHPATDLFMRGVFSVTIVKVGRKYLHVFSHMHNKTFKVHPSAIAWGYAP